MINIQVFTFNPFAENTLIVSNANGGCFIVDPGCYDRNEEKEIEDYISSNKLRPLALLNTHCHIDHVFGNDFISRKYGLSPLIHPLEKQVLAVVPQVAGMYGLNYTPSPEPGLLPSGEIALENEIFEILEVPGHSPGHVAFYHRESGNLISGDVLFRESVGRTDLPGGDMDVLKKSITEKLYRLPDQTKVYPGHMGLTDIGHEKKYNPFVRG